MKKSLLLSHKNILKGLIPFLPLVLFDNNDEVMFRVVTNYQRYFTGTKIVVTLYAMRFFQMNYP